MDSGDDRSSTADVGSDWTLIPGPASALIDKIARKRVKSARIWQNWTDWSDCAARFLLEELGRERAHRLLEMIDKAGPELGPMFTMDRLRALLRI
jgi:hypothetical protein